MMALLALVLDVESRCGRSGFSIPWPSPWLMSRVLQYIELLLRDTRIFEGSGVRQYRPRTLGRDVGATFYNGREMANQDCSTL